jgi:hypothetical protein
MSKFLFAAFLCVCHARLISATYHISASGDDSAPGTSEASAWKTINAVNGFSFKPGDQVLFRGGERFQGSIVFDADDSGTPGSPIVVASYGQGRATIEAGAGAGFKAVNAAGIEIRNLVFVGSGRDSNPETGICFWLDRPGVKLEHIVIDGVEASGFGKEGISIGSWHESKCGYRDVRVSRSDLHNNRLAGMVAFGFMDPKIAGWSHERFHIDHCSFRDNLGDPAKQDNHSGNGVVLGDVDGGVIEYCLAYNNGSLCNSTRGGPCGIWAYESNKILIQFNEAYDNRIGSCKHDGGGFDLDGGCTNSVMQFNYSHDNTGAGFLVGNFPDSRTTRDNVVRFNISENDGRANNHSGIHVYAGTNCQVYNNTVYIGPGYRGTPAAMQAVWEAEGTKVWNNIFQSAGGVPVLRVLERTELRGNIYYSGSEPLVLKWGKDDAPYDSLAEFRRASGQESGSGSDQDPRLNDPGAGGTIGDARKLATLKAYTISADSPLRTAGVVLDVTMPAHDFFGNPLSPGVFGIGACVPAP